jgi:hypothetical protein
MLDIYNCASSMSISQQRVTYTRLISAMKMVVASSSSLIFHSRAKKR